MSRSMEGVVTVVQEGRLQLVDGHGVGHLFILGPNAAAETQQLTALQHRQARVRVRYSAGENVIGNLLSAIELIS